MSSPAQITSQTGIAGAAPLNHLTALPEDILDQAASFIPDEVHRLLGSTCKAFRKQFRSGQFLGANAERIWGALEHLPGSLRNRVRNDFFVQDKGKLEFRSGLTPTRFHRDLITIIRSMGIPRELCPPKILSPNEVALLHEAIQPMQDRSLATAWPQLQTMICHILTQEQMATLPPGDRNLESLEPVRNWLWNNTTLYGTRNSLSNNFPEVQLLRMLFLQDLRMECIPTEIFLCTGLLELNLLGNCLTTITKRTFYRLVHLENLCLSYNQLTSLEHGAFEGPSKLFRLILNNNQLLRIDPDTFGEHTALKTLTLHNNQLTLLDRATFHTMTALRELTLFNNPFFSISLQSFEALHRLELLLVDDTVSQTLRAPRYSQPLIFWDPPPDRQMPYHEDFQHFRRRQLPILRAIRYPHSKPRREDDETLKILEFFNYTPESNFAKFYQLVADTTTPHEVLLESWSALARATQDSLLRGAGFNQSASTQDPGLFHREEFRTALKRYVKEWYERKDDYQKSLIHALVYELSPQRLITDPLTGQAAGLLTGQAAVAPLIPSNIPLRLTDSNFSNAIRDNPSINGVDTTPNWREFLARDNIPRFIDAILRLEKEQVSGPAPVNRVNIHLPQGRLTATLGRLTADLNDRTEDLERQRANLMRLFESKRP